MTTSGRTWRARSKSAPGRAAGTRRAAAPARACRARHPARRGRRRSRGRPATRSAAAGDFSRCGLRHHPIVCTPVSGPKRSTFRRASVAAASPARCRRRRRRTAPGRPASGRRSGEPRRGPRSASCSTQCRKPSSRTVVDVVPGEPPVRRPRRRGRRRRRAGRARTGPRRGRAARPATAAARRARATASCRAAPMTPMLRPGARGQRDRGGAAVPRRCTARRRRAARRRCAAGRRQELVERRARGCRRTAAVASRPAGSSSKSLRSDLVDGALPGGVRDADDLVAVRDARLVVHHGVPARAGAGSRRCSRRAPGGPGAAPIRSTNCSKIAGRTQNASMLETSWLASTRWMPWDCGRGGRRPPAAATASLVTASFSPNRYWNSSITATIRGQLPVRVEPRAAPRAW